MLLPVIAVRLLPFTIWQFGTTAEEGDDVDALLTDDNTADGHSGNMLHTTANVSSRQLQ